MKGELRRYAVVNYHTTVVGKEDCLFSVDIPDGMGSLLLIPQGQSNTKRLFKAQISEALFKDIDDVDVLISLNIDQNDLLYELDIWKMNYGPLISFANLFTDNGNIKQTLSWE